MSLIAYVFALFLATATVPPAVAVKGTATHYAYHEGQAAAGAILRDALGPGWRGTWVEVCGRVGCRTVKLTDYMSSKRPRRAVDLDKRDFRHVCGELWRGVCEVTVTRVDGRLPATDTAP